mmetsp:Transcript_36091/g.86462  ORF Transcript_36091/g.86462 Transcript_36091/m.86462 type:complete len:221 (-) Transcript_36091:84-746(-)
MVELRQQHGGPNHNTLKHVEDRARLQGEEPLFPVLLLPPVVPQLGHDGPVRGEELVDSALLLLACRVRALDEHCHRIHIFGVLAGFVEKGILQEIHSPALPLVNPHEGKQRQHGQSLLQVRRAVLLFELLQLRPCCLMRQVDDFLLLKICVQRPRRAVRHQGLQARHQEVKRLLWQLLQLLPPLRTPKRIHEHVPQHHPGISQLLPPQNLAGLGCCAVEL